MTAQLRATSDYWVDRGAMTWLLGCRWCGWRTLAGDPDTARDRMHGHLACHPGAVRPERRRRRR